MMARYEGALWRPVGYKTDLAPAMVATCSITHSDAGFVESLQGWWCNPGSGPLVSHFHVSWDGTVEQYVDTDRQAVANVEANWFAIATEVSNSPAYRDRQVSFDADVYSQAQIDALIGLYRWQAATHPGIPKEVCGDGRHGFGWHDQYPQWTTPSHVCPGKARVFQLQTIIFPAVFKQDQPVKPHPLEDQFMSLTPDETSLLRSAAVAGKPLVFRDAGTGYAYALQPRSPLLERVTDQKTINLMVLCGMWTVGNGRVDKLGTIATDAIKHLSGWVPAK